MVDELKGRVAIVSGSGRGLGLAYAQELAARGASVIVNDVDPVAAQEAVASITAAGGAAVAVVAPVGTTEVAEQLVKSLLRMTDDDFDTVLTVHARGTFICVREAFRYFKENGVPGRIVCIGSPTGQRGNFGQTNYAAAKAAIVGMVRTWAIEMKKAGVTVNAVIPVAATAMTETVPYFKAAVDAQAAGEAVPEFFRKDIGFGTAADVSGLISYLASDAAGSITGQAIGIGGDRVQIWSHPEPVVTAYHDGGWSLEALSADFAATLVDNAQSVGEEFPALPADLAPVVA
jgi:NAD(P)-dependent dehydrogenase (short-subunit alcohol dehydrogenase family)